MGSESDALGYYAMRGGIGVLEIALDVLSKVSGAGAKGRDMGLVALSLPYLRMQSEDGKATRPIAFLTKYLAGAGEDEILDLYTVMSEDKGVRSSVHRQISTFMAQQELFKSTGLDTSRSGRLTNARSLGLSEAPEAYRQKVGRRRTEELQIDVPQADFQINDWCNAIGGFRLSWSLVDVRTDRKAVLASLWGSNLYRWHPELERRSQRIHRAAERLKEFGANDFRIVFKPCLISVATGELQRA